jgi:hypothetical protein
MSTGQSEKGAFIEKMLFAILPLIIAGVGYLLSAVSNLAHQVTILESKVSLVVTSDNKQASNTGAELAREKLRQDLGESIQRNRDTIHDNQQKIAVLEEKLRQLQAKIGSK